MKKVPHCIKCEHYHAYDEGFSLADRKTIIFHRCEYENKGKDLYAKDLINSPKWCPLRITK